MIQVIGGELHQWDTDRKVGISDDSVTHVHFANQGDRHAVVMNVENGEASIPNFLLMTGRPVNIYAVSDNVTIEYLRVGVRCRERPEHYVYEEDSRNFVYQLIQDVNNATQEARDVVEEIHLALENGDFVGPQGEKGDPGAVRFVVVNELPQVGDTDAIYLLNITDSEEDNLFDEYIFVEGKWEKIGSSSVAVNLDEYVKKTDYATNLIPGVVIVGEGLMCSSNGKVNTFKAKDSEIVARSSNYRPIVPSNLDYAVKVAMTTNKEEWTEEEKASARDLLGITGTGGTSIDDSTVGDKAWSSRHIVDSMCPEVEISGAEVSGQFVGDTPLQVVSHITESQEGSGDPCPGGNSNLIDESMVRIVRNDVDISLKNLPAGTYTFSVQGMETPTYITVKGTYTFDDFYTNPTVLTPDSDGDLNISLSWWDGIPTEDFQINMIKLEVGSIMTPAANIRPFIGRDSLKLTHTGKNLFDISKVESTDGCINNGDGSLTIKNGNGFRLKDVAPKIFQDIISLKDKDEEGSATISISAKSSVSGTMLGFSDWGEMGPLDAGSGAGILVWEYIFNDDLDSVWFSWDSEEETATICDIQIEYGKITDYNPYYSQETLVDLGQTVYGGSYNWNTGVLSIDKYVTQITSKMEGYSQSGWKVAKVVNGVTTFITQYNDAKIDFPDLTHPVVSTHYKKYTSPGEDFTIRLDSGYLYITDSRFSDVESFKAFLDKENVQLVYKRRFTKDVFLDPQQISATYGLNILSSDTGDTTVKGKMELSAYLSQLQDTIAQQAQQIADLQAAAVNNI